MDAETRAQLERNSLAMALAETPAFLSRHGTKILIAICVLLLVITLIQRRNRAAIARESNQAIYISNAREMVQQLNRLPDVIVDDTDRTTRVAMATDALTALDEIRDLGDEPSKMEALLIRGDLYRQLARQPKLGDGFEEPAAYLYLAIQSYQAALADAREGNGPLGQQRIAARLGLAAAYEDAGKFDEAKPLYAAVDEDAAATSYQKLLASQRAEMLDELVDYRTMPEPNFLAPATQPAATTQESPTTQAAPMLGDFGVPTE